MMTNAESFIDAFEHSGPWERPQREEARRRMKALTRRKRRAFEEAQKLKLYRLFMSIDSATAWRTLREPRTTTPIEDPQVLHDYAEGLYG